MKASKNLSWLRVAAFVWLLGAFSVAARGQNVRIEGMTANAAGKRIELYCYDDMLTLGTTLLDAATVDSTGRFSLACYLNYPRLVYVEVENYSQSFYAEPGRSYEVWLPEFRWEQDEERNVFLDPVALPLEFLNLPEGELNLRILRYEEVVDSLLSAERVHLDFRFHRDRRWFDTVERKVYQLLGRSVPKGDEAAADFFDRYVDYSLATMRYGMGFGSRRQLHDRYVAGRQVLYHDECFMRMLVALYEDMVSGGTRKVAKGRLVAWVVEGDLDTYMDSLGTDPLLYDEQLRELAALVALKESYYDADYSREGVVRMVRRVAEGSKFVEHRRLAARLAARLTAPERAAEVEGVVLPDVDGRARSMDSLRGKWVYLSFVRVTDPNSLREIETMAHFFDSVYSQHDDVCFVSISCDREFQKMFHFLRTGRRGGRYGWMWLHFDGDYRLLERYGVVSFPTFVLIDPEGRVREGRGLSPGEGFLLHAPWQQGKEEEDDEWGQGLNNWNRNK